MPGGLRFNQGKARLDLLDVEALHGTAEVLTAGARKYAERNWEKGMAWSKPYASLLRHAFKWWSGEEFDRESGLRHVDHIATNAMFLQHYVRHHPQDDDRPKRKADSGRSRRGVRRGAEPPATRRRKTGR